MRRIIVVGIDVLRSGLVEEFEIKPWPEVEMNLQKRSAGPEVTHRGKRVAQWKVESAKRGGAR